MSEKLSQKQKEETITKGYLDDQDYVTKDFLKSQNYVTKDFLKSQNYVTKDFLKSQNYVTKDFLMGEFKTTFRNELELYIEDSFKRHVKVLMEDNHDTVMTLIEAFQNRFEVIETKLGLKY